MKINYYSYSEFPSKAANSIQVIQMCKSLTTNSHSIRLHGYKSPDYKNSAELSEYYGINTELNFVFSSKCKIKGIKSSINGILNKMTFKSNTDLIYGRDFHTLYNLRNKGIPIILEVHSPPLKSTHKYIQKKIFKSKNFIHLVVISQNLRNEYLNIFPFLKGKIIVAHDAANEIAIDNGKVPLDISNKIVKHKFNVGYIGHLYKGRGMDIIKYLCSNNSWAHFHIVGGKKEDIIFWENEFQNIENVTFWGFITPRKIPQIQQNLDILIAPYENKISVHSGKADTSKWMSPLKIFEYMASGKPFLTSDIEVLKEVLTHKQNSLLCDPNNLQDWHENLNKLKNPELRETLSSNALKDFSNNYTWEIRSRKVLGDIETKVKVVN